MSKIYQRGNQVVTNQRRPDNTMTKIYQRGNQEGINQRRTDNTMTKKYQRGNQEGTNQRRTDNTMDKTKKTKHYTDNKKKEEYHKNQVLQTTVIPVTHDLRNDIQVY